MIRPRGGDFVYSDSEFNEMKTSILRFKYIADGFIFGILDSESRVDVRRVLELVELAAPRPCTFHRAFDHAADLIEALERIVECGMWAILTSGGASTAMLGCDKLAKLVESARGRITIMPGGGIRSSNIGELMAETSAVFYHLSALVENEEVANLEEVWRLKRELQNTQE